MKATELRIGNLIQVHCNVETVRRISQGAPFTTYITFTGVMVGDNNEYWMDAIKPITLTEEWHDKMSKTKIVRIDSEISFEWQFDCVKMYVCGFFFKRINHVHDIQNIWHSITGEELEFKEESK